MGDDKAELFDEATEVSARAIDLAGMKAGPDLEADFGQRFANRVRAAEGAGGALEGGQEGIARGVRLATPEAADLPAHARVMLGLEFPPFAVAERGRTLGRAHDVGEQDGGDGPFAAHDPPG